QPLRSSPLGAVPLGAVAQPDDPTTLQQSTQALAPTAIQDIPLGAVPVGDAVLGLSDNRGLADEQVDVTTTQDNSTLVVAVLGYQAAASDEPYVLRAQVTDPPSLPPCPTRQFQSSATPSVSIPSASSTTQALILLNEKRLQDTYGMSAADLSALMTKLNAFA